MAARWVDCWVVLLVALMADKKAKRRVELREGSTVAMWV
jgi:hypothetical protein